MLRRIFSSQSSRFRAAATSYARKAVVSNRELSTTNSVNNIDPLLPKTLDQIVKRDLLESQPRENVEKIWNEFFRTPESSNSVGMTLHESNWETISQRAQRAPLFVAPVVKNEDGSQFFTLFQQFSNRQLIYTFLEDYMKNPNAAKPYMSLTPYLEFKISKGVVLLRGEFLPYLAKQEAENVMKQTIEFYTVDEKYKHVEQFNLDSENFSFPSAFPNVKF